MSVFVCLKSLQHYGTKWGPFDTAQVYWWTEADGETLGGKETGRQTPWRTSSQTHQGDMAAVACNELWLWDRGRSQKRLEMFLGFASSPCNCDDCFPLYVRDVSSWTSKLLQRPGQLLVSGNLYRIFFFFFFRNEWFYLILFSILCVWAAHFIYLILFYLYLWSLTYLLSVITFLLFCVSAVRFICVSLGFFILLFSTLESLRCHWDTVQNVRMRPLPACFIGWCRLDRRAENSKERSKKKPTAGGSDIPSSLNSSSPGNSSSFLQGDAEGTSVSSVVAKGKLNWLLVRGYSKQSKFIFQDVFDLLIIK